MKHPIHITHCGATYSLAHLQQSIRTFSWICEDERKRAFSVRIRYTNHCYSDDPPHPVPEGAHMVPDNHKKRMFCTKRHAHSLALPDIIGGLFEKPTTTISRTKQERNWSMYRLKATPDLANGEKYFVFIQVYSRIPPDGDKHFLDLWVQSAYARRSPVPTDQHFPFGRVAERIALNRAL